MTRGLWALASLASLALGILGCTPSDQCGDAPDGAVCVTVHLTGAIDVDAHITSLQVDSQFTNGNVTSGAARTRRRLVTPQDTDAGTPSLPIAFAVIFESPAVIDESSRIIVLARDGVTAVGVGSAQPTTDFTPLKPNTHLQVNLALSPAKDNPCFDMVKATGNTTDLNCGGPNCPACGIGQKCNGNTDCGDLTRTLSCQSVSGSGLLCSAVPPPEP